MEQQIDRAKAWGAHGLVFGILRTDETIDFDRTRVLVDRAAPLPVTFHRAFDRCPDLEASAHALAEAGVKRILTSGGRASAEEGLEVLRVLNEEAGRHITILPGGGVRPANIRRILDFTGVTEIHSAARNSQGEFETGIVEAMNAELMQLRNP